MVKAVAKRNFPFAVGAFAGFIASAWILFSVGFVSTGSVSLFSAGLLEQGSKAQIAARSVSNTSVPQTSNAVLQDKAHGAETMKRKGEEERGRQEVKKGDLETQTPPPPSSSLSSTAGSNPTPPGLTNTTVITSLSSPQLPQPLSSVEDAKVGVDTSLPPFDFRPSDVLPPGTPRFVRAIAACYRNDHFKFHFVHLPKNGGSSLIGNLRTIICEAMAAERGATEGQVDTQCSRSALAADNVILVRDNMCVTREGYFSFAFMRNPWDRAVSMWSYGLLYRTLKMPAHYLKKVAKEYCSFRTFLEKRQERANPELCGRHADSHQWPVIVHRTGKAQFNFVGRLERFGRDWATILKKIDPSGKLLEIYTKRGFTIHNDSGHKKSYTDYYTDDLKAAVARIWADDVKKLGYEFVTEKEQFDAKIINQFKNVV